MLHSNELLIGFTDSAKKPERPFYKTLRAVARFVLASKGFFNPRNDLPVNDVLSHGKKNLGVNDVLSLVDGHMTTHRLHTN